MPRVSIRSLRACRSLTCMLSLLMPQLRPDPCYPLWFDKQNVVPLDKVRAALEEFCFNDGKRPTSVDWEPGTMNGQRLEPQEAR
ncbi:Imm1 family immunity protein [Streptomyces sp. NPDC058280]|uniref:Imm1 family immunity protein n=1 Tax=Streptomyces sp. NPDC058280 TaxID=3346419 RepID=UPI0036F0D024